jgi:hypothetical protein
MQLNPCGHIPYVTSSLMGGWVCLLGTGFASSLSSVHIAHIACYWKFFLLLYIQVLFVSPGFSKRIMPFLLILCYNYSLVTWMVVCLTAAEFKRHTFSMSIFALSYAANMFILMILYEFCLSQAQFCYIIIYIEKVESCMQITDLCAPWKISNGAESLVLQALQF